MAKLQRGDSEAKAVNELRGNMSDLSDDEGPEEVTFDDSKAVALKSVKDARDSVKRYSVLGLLAHLLACYPELKPKSLPEGSIVHYSAI